MCEQFSSLPYPGGLYDQPFSLVLGMNIVLGAIEERRERTMKSKSKSK